jgi:hypothetical protein
VRTITNLSRWGKPSEGCCAAAPNQDGVALRSAFLPTVSSEADGRRSRHAAYWSLADVNPVARARLDDAALYGIVRKAPSRCCGDACAEQQRAGRGSWLNAVSVSTIRAPHLRLVSNLVGCTVKRAPALQPPRCCLGSPKAVD